MLHFRCNYEHITTDNLNIQCIKSDEITWADNNLPENRTNNKEPSEKEDDCSVDIDPSTNKESSNQQTKESSPSSDTALLPDNNTTNKTDSDPRVNLHSNVLPANSNLGVVGAVNHQGKVTSDNHQNTSDKNDDLKIHDNSTIKGITINYTYSL